MLVILLTMRDPSAPILRGDAFIISSINVLLLCTKFEPMSLDQSHLLTSNDSIIEGISEIFLKLLQIFQKSTMGT